MARTTKPLNDTQARNAKPKEREYCLYDGQGLALRVKPNGSKTWLFNYIKPYTTKRTNLGLGTYPEVSLSDARAMRSKHRTLLAKNIDPKEFIDKNAAEKQLQKSSTLYSVASEWHEIKKARISEKHSQRTWNMLSLHIFPKLGKYPVNELKAQEVIRYLKPIEANGNLETVRRLCQNLNEIMSFAVNTGRLQHNPLIGIKAAFQTPTPKHLPTLRPEKLPELIRKIYKTNMNQTTRQAILWQLHTMVRPAEAAKAKWEEIDREKMLWVIPAEKMKKTQARKKIDPPHFVPLSPQAIEILNTMKPISGHRPYIFPSYKDPKKHINESSANAALRRMGYKDELVAHGMRSIASTALNESGLFEPDVIEKGLAHTEKNEVRKAYNRAEYLEPRKEMMNWWSNFITNK